MMISKLFGLQKKARITPEELDAETDKVNEMLTREGPRMTALANYLEQRKNQNGFGSDFDYSLRPKGVS